MTRKPVDAEKVIRRFRLRTAPEGDKHHRVGWEHFQCPYCKSSRYLLGWNLLDGYFRCWKCGWHPTLSTFAKLANKSEAVIRVVLGDSSLRKRPLSDKREDPCRVVPSLPERAVYGELKGVYARYLRDRGFDPRDIAQLWGVGMGGPLGEAAWRLVIPVNDPSGELAGWQARAVAEDLEPKYLFPRDMDRTRLVYGADRVPYGSPLVVCEGATDVWRVGLGAVATFGVQWTNIQAMQLVDVARERGCPFAVILYDTEPQAQRQAQKLQAFLETLWLDTWVLQLENHADPGDMTPADVDALWRTIYESLCPGGVRV